MYNQSKCTAADGRHEESTRRSLCLSSHEFQGFCCTQRIRKSSDSFWKVFRLPFNLRESELLTFIHQMPSKNSTSLSKFFFLSFFFASCSPSSVLLFGCGKLTVNS